MEPQENRAGTDSDWVKNGYRTDKRTENERICNTFRSAFPVRLILSGTVCNSNATRWLSFVTPLAVKYKLKDRFQRFHRTAKFVGSSLGLKQGSPLTSVFNKLPELNACSPLDALSLFDDMTISKRTLLINKTLKITFPNGGKNLYPRHQCNIPVQFTTQRIIYYKNKTISLP